MMDDAEQGPPTVDVDGIGVIDLGMQGGDHPPTSHIPIHSVQVGYRMAIDTSSGLNTGAVRFTALTVTKRLDLATPPLLRTITSGHHIATVRIVLFQPGTTDEAARFDLSDVLVTAVDVDADDAVPPSESVSFTFERIRVTYTATDGTQAQAGWDLQQHSPV